MSTPTRSRSLPRATAMIAILALLFAACGNSTDDQESEVATLETELTDLATAAEAATSDGESTASELSPDEAALAFSQCMRDEGLDFPDLSIDAEGNVELRAAFQTVNPQVEGFRQAMGVCGEILQQSTGFGGDRRALLESPEVQDALLAFSQCVRDEGYDVGDLTLERPGRGPGQGPGAGSEGEPDDPAGDGSGGPPEREPGFGNRSARLAENLGLDYEDPAVQETIEGCMPILEEAFSEAGLGR
ncbi:MAG: hypothetical protein GY724_13895 [Actinomycetia bacterium]|nr:hypothetical protein [Actinomycetes bacterium]